MVARVHGREAHGRDPHDFWSVAGLARYNGAWIGGNEIQADWWTTARELFVPATQCDEPKQATVGLV